jgi:hypothetical protein
MSAIVAKYRSEAACFVYRYGQEKLCGDAKFMHQ